MRMLGGGNGGANGGYGSAKPTGAAPAVAPASNGATREGEAVPMGMGFDFLSQG
jgi:hypothetical protein